MIVYSLRRLGAGLVVAWLAMTLAFVALRWAPGDAVDVTIARSGIPAGDLEARRDALGLNDPLWVQYTTYMAGLVRGDWGESLVSRQPVAEMILQNAGATVALASGALFVAVVLGVGLGLLAGAAPWRILRYGAEGIASLALSTPVYWTATLAIFLFTTKLALLPGPGGHGLRYMVLPALVLGFHTAGGIAQVTTSSIREASAQDFVWTARGKGLPEWDVLDHILRVGLLPVIAVVALQLGFLLSGTVITEVIFVRQGLGKLLLKGIAERDYPVIQGLVALAALVYSLVNALADVLYALVDPRVVREE